MSSLVRRLMTEITKIGPVVKLFKMKAEIQVDMRLAFFDVSYYQQITTMSPLSKRPLDKTRLRLILGHPLT